MKVSVTHSGLLDKLIPELSRQADQLPYITARALTMTAQSASRAGAKKMASVFDRPKPVTLKSLYILPANSKDTPPKAMVYVKQTRVGYGPSPKDLPRASYIALAEMPPERGSMAYAIGQQFTGGRRNPIDFEVLLRKNGYIGKDDYVMPGPDARLDKYGNVPVSFYNQAKAALRINRDVYANASSSRRSRSNAKKAMNLFWSLGTGKVNGGTLARGLWGSDGKGNLKRFLAIIKTPTYKPLINLNEIVRETIDKEWAENFSAAMEQAIATKK